MEKNLKKHVGSRIQQSRKLIGLKQSELAEKTGRSVETISNIERGAVWTSLDMLESLSDALEIPIEEFFDGYDPRVQKSAERLKIEAELRMLQSELNTNKLSVIRDLARSLSRAR